MDFSRKNVFLNAFCALVLLALSIFLIPQTYLLGDYKTASKDIRFLEHTQTYLMDDYVEPDKANSYHKQFLPAQGGKPRRYNFNFDEEDPVTGAKSIYIPSLTKGAHMSVNGIPFEVSKPTRLFAPGFGQDWFVQDLPRSHLTPGNNRIDIHFPNDTQKSGLRQVYIGPTHIITRISDQQERWMRWLPKIGLALSAFACLICIIGLLFGKFNTAFAIMGGIGSLAVLQFLQSFLPSSFYSPSLSYALKIIIPAGLLALLWMWWRTPKRTDNFLNPILITLLLIAGLGPFIGLVTMFFPFPLPAPLGGASWVLTSTLPLLLTWPLVNLIQDLDERRSVLEALRLKVTSQEQLLDEKSRVIAEEMRKRAILEERQRFTRDIHDGIGGQLLSLLLKIRSGKMNIDSVATEIQAGINDLRLVVDSMDHTGDNLEMALSTFKARTARQLDSAGINFSWKQTPEFDFSLTSTRDILNLYRFLQESVSNVIRHAKAENLEIAITNANKLFAIHIRDDGIGLPKEKLNAGKGMANLDQRAKLLGGEVEFQKGLDGKGVCVKLTIPHTSRAAG